MSVAIAAVMLVSLAASGPARYVEGPCEAVHYGRPGHKGEVSMGQVVYNRQHTRKHRIAGFTPRRDVEDFIAVRNADHWRIAQNWRALVVFRLPNGGLSRPVWVQPADYQQRRHMSGPGCRVETSEALAASFGWSMYAQNEGHTTAYILRWER